MDEGAGRIGEPGLLGGDFYRVSFHWSFHFLPARNGEVFFWRDFISSFLQGRCAAEEIQLTMFPARASSVVYTSSSNRPTDHQSILIPLPPPHRSCHQERESMG